MDDTIISENVDQYVYLGFLSMRENCEEEAQSLLESILQELENSTNDVFETLDQGWQIIERYTEQAIEYLQSDATTYLYEDNDIIPSFFPSEIYEDAPPQTTVLTAMCNLDQLLYFGHTLDILVSRQHNDKLTNILNKVTTLILERDLYGESIPYHRLIPLNIFRKEILKQVNENYHYLFPWYNEWNEKPSSTWKNYGYLMAGEYEGEGFFDESLRNVFFNDEPLYKRVLLEAEFCRALPGILSEDKVYPYLEEMYRLTLNAEPLDSDIVNAGRVDAAIRVAVADCIAKEPIHQWRIEAALFGMGLSRDEQEKILEDLFHEGINDAPDLENLGTFFQDMEKRLLEKAQSGFTRLPCNNFFFRQLLTCSNPERLAKIITLWDEGIGTFERLRTYAKKVSVVFGQLSPTTGYQYPIAVFLDDENESAETAPFPFELFPTRPMDMPQPIQFNRGRRRKQQGWQLKILQEEENSELREKIEQFRDRHWCGVAVGSGGIVEFPITPGFPEYIELPNEQGYDMVVLSFHPDRDVLEKMNSEEGVPEAVATIIYLKQEKNI